MFMLNDSTAYLSRDSLELCARCHAESRPIAQVHDAVANLESTGRRILCKIHVSVQIEIGQSWHRLREMKRGRNRNTCLVVATEHQRDSSRVRVVMYHSCRAWSTALHEFDVDAMRRSLINNLLAPLDRVCRLVGDDGYAAFPGQLRHAIEIVLLQRLLNHLQPEVCGLAQQSPSAREIISLVRIDAKHTSCANLIAKSRQSLNDGVDVVTNLDLEKVESPSPPLTRFGQRLFDIADADRH